MQRRFLALLLLILVIAAFAAPATYNARATGLSDQLCVGSAATLDEALGLDRAALDCESRDAASEAGFVRTSTQLAKPLDNSDGQLLWQTDPALFDSIHLRFSYADGSHKDIAVDPQMAADNWFVRSRFSIPVPQADAPLTGIDMVVERPRTHGIIKGMRLIDADQAESDHLARAIFYALLCGLLLAPIFYDILFFPVLRSRFMLWHGLMTVGHLAFVLSISGLIFVLFPDTPLWLRHHINTGSLVVSTVFAALLVVELLERGKVSRAAKISLFASIAILALIKCVTLLDLEAFRMTAHGLFFLTFVPVAISLGWVIMQAAVRGSRAARYLAVSTFGVLMCALFQLLMMLDVLSPYFPIDDVMFVALILLVLGTSVAVADRFLFLRIERDRARQNADALDRLAHCDELTALDNRRAFERLGTIAPDEGMLLLDIDRFKSINDTHGHTVGDRALIYVAHVIRSCFEEERYSARAFRVGGEEFAIVIRGSDEEALREAAECLRRNIEQGSEGHAEIPAITASIGVAAGEGRPVGEVLKKADAALYEAKRAGRNAVRLAA